MANVNMLSNTIPTDYATEQQKLQRQRMMAEALQQQSMQPQSAGQMVGNHFVPTGISPTLAKVMGAFLAGKRMEGIDAQQADLASRYGQDRAKVFAEALQAREGKPAEVIGSEEGNITRPAVPGSNRKMAEVLMGSQFPELQQVGMSELLKKPDSPFGKVDPKDYTADSIARFAQTQNYADLQPARKVEVAPSGVAFNPYDVKPGTVFQNPNSLMNVGEDGQPVLNQPLLSAKKDIAAAGKAVTNVNVSTEKKFSEKFAEKIASADSDMRDAAIKAPDLANRANSIKEVLATGKVITGTGADARLAIGKAMGLVGASDAETIANTEALSTDLARNTLDSIKASGLGSGSGFSNADRDFLEKAAGGKINLEASTIDRLATLAHKAAASSTDRWNTRVKQIPRSALEGTGITTDPVQVPQLFTPKRRASDQQQYNPQEVVDEMRRRGLVK